jgi:beta-glucosidase
VLRLEATEQELPLERPVPPELAVRWTNVTGPKLPSLFGSVSLREALSTDDAAASAEASAKAACAKLSFSMKVDMMHGRGWMSPGSEIDGYGRNTGCGGTCGQGRTTFRWDNGPQGFSDNSAGGTSTQFPSQLNMAATFDPALAKEFGVAMGVEWWDKGTNILEGPGINVMRIPYNGRTFEYMVGEDPVLGSTMVGPVIDGIQQNAMAVAKHFILNNQEFDRHGVNEVVDEKTLMELYSPPFETAAKHQVAGYMCAYNRVNGEYACEQPDTLKSLLRESYQFKGFVVSDWGATHSTSKALASGLDIEMPGSKWFNEANFKAEMGKKQVQTGQLDEACEHILQGFYQLPPSHRVPCSETKSCIDKNVSTAEHKLLARKLAAASTVLLKNDAAVGAAAAAGMGAGLLPLDPKKPLTIALVGPEAAKPYVAGGGSGGVKDSNVLVSPLAAFTARLGKHVTVVHASGCLNGKPDPKGAVAAAAAADVAIVISSARATEGWDRENLDLHVLRCDGKDALDSNGIERSLNNEQWSPNKEMLELREKDMYAGAASFLDMRMRGVSMMQWPEDAGMTYSMEELIKDVAAKQPNTVVAMAVPGPVLTTWRPSVKAILCAFLPGEQYGNALFDLVYGSVAPQARLPVTMPLTANDQKMSEEQYPGRKTGQKEGMQGHREAKYTEGQIVGYRWYDRHDVQPAFPFGFGLSYAAFTYSNLRVEGRTVAFWVHRTGASGCDTPQLYVSYPTAAEDHTVPVKVLRYFRKTCAAATEVTYTLSARDLSTWDVERGAWVQLTGVFGIHVLAAAQTEGPMCNGPCPALHGSLKVDPSTVPELKPFPPPPSPPEPPPSLPPSPPPPTEEQEEEEEKETKVSTAAPKPAEAGGKHCLTDGQCGKGFHCGASRVCEASGTPAATKTEANAEHKPPAATTTKPAAATTKAPAPKPAGATHCETDGQCSKGFHCGASFVCEAAPTTLIAERAHDLEGRGAKRSLTPA